MKIDNETLKQMTNDINVVINYYGIDRNKLDANDLYNVWYHTYMNRAYDDNNLNVKKDNSGNRILSQIKNYEVYPCGTNDTTIMTAINKILVDIQK